MNLSERNQTMKLLALLVFVLFAHVGVGQNLNYPMTRQLVVVDTFFNQVVTDEYRWLEEMQSSECQAWIEQQNQLTKKELKKAASKGNSFQAINRLAYVRYDFPKKQGEYYFTYAYQDNLNERVLFVQNSLRDSPALLVDPKFISKNESVSIADYSCSKDSKYLAYEFNRNGSDWGEIKVVNIKTGIHLSDHLKQVKFSSIAWKDNGFYYSTYPNQGNGQTQGQEVYYHQLNTEQSADKLVFKRSANPHAYFRFFTTSDERYLILKEIDEKKGVINIFYIDFESDNLDLYPLLTKLTFNDDLTILDNYGDDLIALSRKDGNNGFVVKINPSNPRVWTSVIPEYDSAVLMHIKLLEEQIIGVYQSSGKQKIIMFDYDGNVLKALELPLGFSSSGFEGEKTDKQLLFSYESYTQPKIVYILNVETLELKPLRATIVNFDYTQYETLELVYESFDGVPVPMLMVYKKGIDLKGDNPTLLKAYGGFGIVEEPRFDPGIVHFLDQGGIFVFANIRGGGDNGRDWQEQGSGLNKQNSFKDFIAAAEYLIHEGYTSPQKLAITGASNGGLVVGVAMTQRPDLFKVAVPVVAPMDMLRFENFTVGHLHRDEYGSVADSSGFQRLFQYSPLHNIHSDVNYPATLIMTSEFDDRVPPLHSYKFVAKMQNRAAQKSPVLLRVERSAGHYGAAGSLFDRLQEQSDMYDFILYHLSDKH